LNQDKQSDVLGVVSRWSHRCSTSRVASPHLSRHSWSTRTLAAVAAFSLLATPVASASTDGQHGDFNLPGNYPFKVPAREGSSGRAVADRPAVTAVKRDAVGRQVSGTLSGKAVYVSAGHGWVRNPAQWNTQRGNNNGVVEDFITIETVNQYLIPYLQRMGAHVVSVREADLSPLGAVVDDAEATLEGNASEHASTDKGFKPYTALGLMDQPFLAGGARQLDSAAAETGRVVYAPEIPATGKYNVYVSYKQGTNRVADAHYIVRHGGGESHFRVDQRRHGQSWVLLGRFWFEAGAPVEQASVAIANDSASGGVISFDAIRIGGGMSPVNDISILDRPTFELAARSNTQMAGAPPDVYLFRGAPQSDDVVSRPRFTAWEHDDGEDAAYVAIHTNAPAPARGTMSIAYGPTYPCCGTPAEFTGVAGGVQLMDAIHREVIGDLRSGFDPAWRDDLQRTANLGELNPEHNAEIPSVLIELAYHDTPADATALKEPAFRRIAARAVAQGVAKFFAQKDGRPLVLPPEPPSALRVENTANGLRVTVRPPAPDQGGGDAPTGYRVYLSSNGRGFDEGTSIAGGATETVITGLEPGAVRYVQVTAENAGGESLPTEVVGARVSSDGHARVLVVGGFDRLDSGQTLHEMVSGPLGVVDRVYPDEINDGSYALRHGDALADAGYSFDGATDDAVEQGDVALTGYQAVDWFVGEDTTGNEPMAASSRSAIAALFAAGGGLVLSGSELVRALSSGSAEEKAFLADVLKVGLAADDAETYDVTAVAGGPLADVPALRFDDEGDGTYDAEVPDVLSPVAGAEAALSYSGDVGAAAVAWKDGDAGAIVMGFPLEMVQGAARTELVAAAMTYLGVEKDAAAPGKPGDPHDGTINGDPDLDGGCSTGGGAGGGFAGLLVGLAMAVAYRSRRRGVLPG
jgi:N-acetylmuramoyl-L-alanine amidase